MYAQQNDDIQSFRRGEQMIPANYAGNAFTLDEEPCPTPETIIVQDDITCQIAESAPPDNESVSECERTADSHSPQKEEKGLLSGLFSRLSRGFELDDILLIGLIILLLQSDCENRDETVILLALLLLVGF